MKNGFYTLQDQYKNNMNGFLEALDSIEAELPIRISAADDDFATVSVGSFLQGFCGELAKFFYREHGLTIGILYDPAGTDMCLCHVFNVLIAGSTTYYLDARGITDDLQLFIEPFAGPGKDLKLVFPNSELEAKALFKDEWDFPEDEISDAMIRWLLDSFSKNYDFGALSPPLPLNEQIRAAAEKASPKPVRLKWIREEAGSYHSEDGRFDITNVYDRILGNHWLLYDNKTGEEYEKDTLKWCKWVVEGHILPHERQKERDGR